VTDAANRTALSQIDPQTLAESVHPNVLAAALKLATAEYPCPAETNPRHYNRDGHAVPCDYHEGHEGDHQVMHRTHGWIDGLEHASVMIPSAPPNGPPCPNCGVIERSYQHDPSRVVCLGCGTEVNHQAQQERLAHPPGHYGPGDYGPDSFGGSDY